MRPSIRIKTALPAAIRNNPLCANHPVIVAHWSNKPLFPYGPVIAGYSRDYPYSVPHIAVENNDTFSVVALDEIDGELPPGIPPIATGTDRLVEFFHAPRGEGHAVD